MRSSEILDQLRVGFDVHAVRGYGGNILSVMYPQLIPAEISDDLVATMIATEKEWLQRAEPHFYAIVVASPKRGRIRRVLASLRYFITPKVKRLGREAARITRR